MDASVDGAASIAFMASGGESDNSSRPNSRPSSPPYRSGPDDNDGRFEREWHTPSVIGVNAVDNLSFQLRVIRPLHLHAATLCLGHEYATCVSEPQLTIAATTSLSQEAHDHLRSMEEEQFKLAKQRELAEAEVAHAPWPQSSCLCRRQTIMAQHFFVCL